MRELVRRFLLKKNEHIYCYKYGSDTVNNLLSERSYGLLAKANGKPRSIESLPLIIEESVKSYPRKKSTAIGIYKLFVDFVNRETGSAVDVAFPPIDSSSKFERRMYIAKYFQVPGNKIEELSDLLWVDTRTIEEDLRVLHAESDSEDDAYIICGKTFSIPGFKRTSGTIKVPSSVHPLFLTSNLTQVLVTLKGLKKMSQEKIYANYANQMAKDIWSQLSDYAKKRIFYVCENLIPDEKEWYESLETDDRAHFHSEHACDGANCVLYALKNGKPCFIDYMTEDGKTIFLANCIICNYDYKNNTVDAKFDGKTMTLDIDRIVRSAHSVEEIL